MPNEDDLRFRLVTSLESMLQFAGHEPSCPEDGASDKHVNTPCPCGFRELRRRALALAAETMGILVREDGESWE